MFANLGAIDVLCTDKTGTLTKGTIRLERHLDIHGRNSEVVLPYAWLNCFFESGIRTPMEEAVLAHESMNAAGWRKIDEVPFDFERRRLSVLLAHQDGDKERRWLILKGAPEDVLAHCTTVSDLPVESVSSRIDKSMQETVRTQLAALEMSSYRALAVAIAIFIMRTSLNPLKSRPHPALPLMAIAVLCFAVALPVLPWGGYFGFVPLPLWFYGVVMLLVLGYLLVAHIVKTVFFKRQI